MRLSHLPLRITTGAYILNSGMTKKDLEGQAAEGLHGMATAALPQLSKMQPDQFATLLSRSEMAIGAALLLPFVPSAVAGAAMAAFGGGLVRLYLKTPGMREEGSIRPTQQGIGLAKDVWLLGAGLTLVLDDLRRRAEH